MANTGGWRKIQAGWYEYTNAAGKVLAYIERSGSVWVSRVLPMADEAQAVTLSGAPRTLAEAKDQAERGYKSLTISAIRRDNETRARVARLGI
jgi:hypothetical protein